MKNIQLIPTDKPSRLHTYKGVLNLAAGEFVAPTIVKIKNDLIILNIFITNDEEIKEGDWYLDTFNTQRIKANEFSDHKHYGNACKKIILTTDQDLINDGVQTIPDEFLEWFVKNPSCESVNITTYGDYLSLHHSDSFHSVCKIILPKEEPKQETLEEAIKRLIKLNRQDAFREGAKWQQERMYSEEEVIKIVEKSRATVLTAEYLLLTEQFKKK